MDYNTQRDKLVMPEYGRHIQKMVEHASKIEDREKRSEQIRAIVNVMGILNPQLRDYPDYMHKLWDHVHAIAGYDLDVDCPFPAPSPELALQHPDPIPLEKEPIKAACYGRNIQGMIDLVAAREDDDIKKEMIRTLAIYMRQQYLIWNKDNVADATIFKDMEQLSGGKLKVPEGIELGPVNGEFSRPGLGQNGGYNRPNFKKRNNQKKRR